MAEMKIQKGLPIQPKKESPEAKMRDAAKMYEKYFLGEMVKAMRSTVTHTEAPSMAENIYNEQLDDQYVNTWADRGGIGLADVIYNQVQERFFGNSAVPRPSGPMNIDKNIKIKTNESKPIGIPVVSPKSLPQKEVSYLYEWDQQGKPASRDVTAPYNSEVLQAFRSGDDRQTMKLAHDNGLVSTISFLGSGRDVLPGEKLSAGDKIGMLAANARGLTWQISQQPGSSPGEVEG